MSGFENEKRVGRFRSKCPSSLLTRLERALTQRMYLVDRSGHQFDADGRVSETFKARTLEETSVLAELPALVNGLIVPITNTQLTIYIIS
jgi:hypothetical protein